MKKFKLEQLIKSNQFELFDQTKPIIFKIHEPDYGLDQIKSEGLKTITKLDITGLVYNQEQLDNLIKLIIQWGISTNPYYKPSEYLKHINPKSNFNFEPNLEEFTNIFNGIKLGGLCWNHNLKYYCQIDLYDDINIVEIFNNKTISKEKVVELILKLVIANKTIANLYNPIEGIIWRLELPELIRDNISNLISK